MANTSSSTKSSFWLEKPLHSLSKAEWESLCDGCGRCCLNKLEDWDSGEIYWTNVACSQLDCNSCHCKNYSTRFDLVKDCIDLTPDKISELMWLPPSCAYRLVAEGKPLMWWHHLISNDRQTVHTSGASVRGRVISEDGIQVEDYEDHLVTWPGEMPDIVQQK